MIIIDITQILLLLCAVSSSIGLNKSIVRWEWWSVIPIPIPAAAWVVTVLLGIVINVLSHSFIVKVIIKLLKWLMFSKAIRFILIKILLLLLLLILPSIILLILSIIIVKAFKICLLVLIAISVVLVSWSTLSYDHTPIFERIPRISIENTIFLFKITFINTSVMIIMVIIMTATSLIGSSIWDMFSDIRRLLNAFIVAIWIFYSLLCILHRLNKRIFVIISSPPIQWGYPIVAIENLRNVNISRRWYKCLWLLILLRWWRRSCWWILLNILIVVILKWRVYGIFIGNYIHYWRA